VETNSSSVVLAFKGSSMIPWALRNKWHNVMVILRTWIAW